MRELDVVIAFGVPTVLRPQIQEAASPLNSWLAGFCRDSRLHAERESTAPTLHSHGSSYVGAWLMGTR